MTLMGIVLVLVLRSSVVLMVGTTTPQLGPVISVNSYCSLHSAYINTGGGRELNIWRDGE